MSAPSRSVKFFVASLSIPPSQQKYPFPPLRIVTMFSIALVALLAGSAAAQSTASVLGLVIFDETLSLVASDSKATTYAHACPSGGGIYSGINPSDDPRATSGMHCHRILQLHVQLICTYQQSSPQQQPLERTQPQAPNPHPKPVFSDDNLMTMTKSLVSANHIRSSKVRQPGNCTSPTLTPAPGPSTQTATGKAS